MSRTATSVDTNSAFSVRYGSGSASGEVLQDFVGFAGYNVSSQGYALCDTVSSGLLEGNVSGLMGESPSRIPGDDELTSPHRSGIPNARSIRHHAILAKPVASWSPAVPRIRLPPHALERHGRQLRPARRISHVRLPQQLPLQQHDQLRPHPRWPCVLLAHPHGRRQREWDERDGRRGQFSRDRYGHDAHWRSSSRHQESVLARTWSTSCYWCTRR